MLRLDSYIPHCFNRCAFGVFISLISLAPQVALADNIIRVSVDSAGQQLNLASDIPAISGQGECVVFSNYQDLDSSPSNGRNASSLYLYRADGCTVNLASGSAAGPLESSDKGEIDNTCSALAMRSFKSGSGGTFGNGSNQAFWRLIEQQSFSREKNALLVNQPFSGLVYQSQQSDGEPGNQLFKVLEGNEVRLTSLTGDANLKLYNDSNISVAARVCESTLPGDEVDICSLDKPIDSAQPLYAVVTDASGTGNSEYSIVTTLVGQYASNANELGNFDSANGRLAISPDGQFVAFDSLASNLVPGEIDANNAPDVYLYDAASRTVQLISSTPAGEAGDGISEIPDVSTDGQFVVFRSTASNLLGVDSMGNSLDTNGNIQDVFLRDLSDPSNPKTILVSVNSAGQQGNAQSFDPVVSADGRFVAFGSNADNLVDENGDGLFTDDDNGRYDIFVRDLQSGTTERVSVTSSGEQGTGHAYLPSISANGRYIAFETSSALVPQDDPLGFSDIYLHDRSTGLTELISVAADGSLADGGSIHADLSADGQHIVFASTAGNLVTGDNNGVQDIFLYSKDPATTAPGSLYVPSSEQAVRITEGERTPIRIARTCGSNTPLTANYQVSDGTAEVDADYQISGDLRWQAGQGGYRSLEFNALQDEFVETNETVVIQFNREDGQSVSSTTVTIADPAGSVSNDQPTADTSSSGGGAAWLLLAILYFTFRWRNSMVNL